MNPPAARSSPSRGSRCSTIPARPRKTTDSAASRLASGAPGSASARPNGIVPMPARMTAIHCASRSSPIRRSVSSGSIWVTRQANVRDRQRRQNPGGEEDARCVVHAFKLYLARMRAVDVIRQKRDGGVLETAAIQAFVRGATDGSWPDYQLSALLMAVVLRGMTTDEAAALTDAMVRSGVASTSRSSAPARSTSTRPAASATIFRCSSPRSRLPAASSFL